MFEHINEIAILVTSLLAVAVGYVWYSPIVFGQTWLRSIGKSPEDEMLSQKEVFFSVLAGVVTHALFLSVLTLAYEKISDVEVGFALFCASVSALIAIQLAVITLREKKPCMYFFIHLGYVVLVTFGGLAVITYWPW